MNFSREIKGYRTRLGFTQQEFADVIGVARNTVNRWEMGIKNPRSETLRRIQNIVEHFGKEESDENSEKAGKEAV